MKCGVWSGECGVWSVKCVEYGVWSVKCKVWSVECEVWSVEPGEWRSVEERGGVWMSVECEVLAQRVTNVFMSHSSTFRCAHYQKYNQEQH